MSLINDIGIVREHVPVDSSLSLKVLSPSLNFCERYFRKILGSTQFAAINAAISSNATTLEQDALLAQIYPSLCRLAIAAWMESGALSISNAGVRRIEDSNEKTPYKYQEDAIKKRLIMEGFELMDDVVSFLEANEDDYPLWKNDPVAYVQFKQFFINRCEVFEQEYGIGGSRTTFRAFAGIMKHVEYMTIRKTIGDALYNELKSQLLTDSLTEDNSFLLSQFIRPAVAHLVIIDALSALPVMITESGVRVIELMQSFPSNVIENTAPPELRDAKTAAARTKAAGYLQALVEYLKSNATAGKYATYYNEKVQVTEIQRNNRKSNSIYRA